MNRLRTKRGRRTAAGVAAGLLVGLPLSAFLAAPSAHADNSPGANLAGLNANAYSTALQFIPLVKGLVPAGNLSTGNFFQVSVPYASSSSETGPASNAIASPVYPGPVATGLPGALQTFGFPASFAAGSGSRLIGHVYAAGRFDIGGGRIQNQCHRERSQLAVQLE
jgi:hypothetical protein